MNIATPSAAAEAAVNPEGHPVGAGIGAALGGAAAGALTGSVAGPIGTVIGIALGAVAGGFAGKDFAELIDPGEEEKYWRENYDTRDYVPAGSDFSDFAPAFCFGITAHSQYPGRAFDEIEAELSARWPDARGGSRLEWAEARPAVRDAWIRIGSATGAHRPGRPA
jgi:hypothetical protein